MEKEELIALLEKLPPKTEVYVRSGSFRDDALSVVDTVIIQKDIVVPRKSRLIFLNNGIGPIAQWTEQ